MKQQYRILVGIPCLFGAEHTKQAIESVVDTPGVEVVLVDNGAELPVKYVLEHFLFNKPNVFLIRNEINQYVNPAWNSIMEFFFRYKEYDRLIIMNSDLIMHKGWENEINGDVIPIISGGETEQKIVTEGTPGVFICLTRTQVEAVYPIPACIRIWFGDQFVFEVLRGLGYLTVIIPGLKASHYNGGSQNCQRLPEFQQVIDEDKEAWSKFGVLDVQTRVSQNQHRRFPKSSLVKPE